MQIRPKDGYRTYPRLDLAPEKRYGKEYNCAGFPRRNGRAATAMRMYLLSMTERCEVPNCPDCENRIVSQDLLQVDHIIPTSANGPASILYRYGTPEMRADGTYATVPFGRSNRLVVPATEAPGGMAILALLYGESHAARIADPTYDCEYDPRNCMIVCAAWNNRWGNRTKPNELDLIQLAVAREIRAEMANPWDWARNRPMMPVVPLRSTVATAERFCAGPTPTVSLPAIETVPQVPQWPHASMGRFSRMALYPVS